MILSKLPKKGKEEGSDFLKYPAIKISPLCLCVYVFSVCVYMYVWGGQSRSEGFRQMTGSDLKEYPGLWEETYINRQLQLCALAVSTWKEPEV